VIVFTVLGQMFDSDSATNPDWSIVIPALLAALGLSAARDNKVSSEKAGASK
jgi:hypothetical protein